MSHKVKEALTEMVWEDKKGTMVNDAGRKMREMELPGRRKRDNTTEMIAGCAERGYAVCWCDNRGGRRQRKPGTCDGLWHPLKGKSKRRRILIIVIYFSVAI